MVQDVLIVLLISKYRVSVSLAVGGNFIEMLPSAGLFHFVDDTAFPCSYWCGAYTLIFSCSFHCALLSFDKISITEYRRNIKYR